MQYCHNSYTSSFFTRYPIKISLQIFTSISNLINNLPLIFIYILSHQQFPTKFLPPSTISHSPNKKSIFSYGKSNFPFLNFHQPKSINRTHSYRKKRKRQPMFSLLPLRSMTCIMSFLPLSIIQSLVGRMSFTLLPKSFQNTTKLTKFGIFLKHSYKL